MTTCLLCHKPAKRCHLCSPHHKTSLHLVRLGTTTREALAQHGKADLTGPHHRNSTINRKP